MHISDLHRSPIDPISNEELISTLVADRDRYRCESYPIRSPNLIVISGDLVQGAPLGETEHIKKIRDQYEIADDFLSNLANRFLDGDKSKLVIVPGNHDIDWNIAFKSMDEVDPNDISNPLLSALTMKGSPFRWCWRSRKLYKITDFDLYESRFGGFKNIHEKFYSDTSHKPIEIHPYCHLHKVDDGRIFIAAFNSCYANDCFSYAGCIPEQAIAKCHLYLRDNNYHNSLLLAVWHHNIEGPPLASDYMDIDAIRRLIGKGFRLGLHGHQHISQAAAHYVHLPQEETMVLVAAGSLCAGHRELPMGTFRQYNIIEILDNYNEARVHVREMSISTTFCPSNSLPSESGSYLDMKWTPLKDLIGRPINIDLEVINKTLLAAEEKYNIRDYDSTIDLLIPIAKDQPPLGRKLLLESLFKLEKWQDIILHTQEPQSIDECVLVVRSMVAEKDFSAARKFLQKWARLLNLPDTQRQEIENWIATLQDM